MKKNIIIFIAGIGVFSVFIVSFYALNPNARTEIQSYAVEGSPTFVQLIKNLTSIKFLFPEKANGPMINIINPNGEVVNPDQLSECGGVDSEGGFAICAVADIGTVGDSTLKDTDNDMIPDAFEEILGYDPSIFDTSGDGKSDWEDLQLRVYKVAPNLGDGQLYDSPAMFAEAIGFDGGDIFVEIQKLLNISVDSALTSPSFKSKEDVIVNEGNSTEEDQLLNNSL